MEDNKIEILKEIAKRKATAEQKIFDRKLELIHGVGSFDSRLLAIAISSCGSLGYFEVELKTLRSLEEKIKNNSKDLSELEDSLWFNIMLEINRNKARSEKRGRRR